LPIKTVDWGSFVDEHVHGFTMACGAVGRSQLVLADSVLGDEHTHTAGRLIFNQAVNDVLQLLNDLGSANGRTAIRTARSLIEHAINLRTVIGT